MDWTRAALLIALIYAAYKLVRTILEAGTQVAIQRELQAGMDRRHAAWMEHQKDLAAMYLTSLLMADEGLSEEPDLVDFFEVLQAGSNE